MKNLFNAIAVFWLSWAHMKGLCKPWHDKKNLEKASWRSECPIIDWINMLLYPRITISNLSEKMRGKVGWLGGDMESHDY